MCLMEALLTAVLVVSKLRLHSGFVEYIRPRTIHCDATRCSEEKKEYICMYVVCVLFVYKCRQGLARAASGCNMRCGMVNKSF